MIAIVDDEPDIRRALARLLHAHGHEVALFGDGHLLLDALPAVEFDCVLLDLNMPAISGFDMLAIMQRMPRRPPVIVVTGHDDPGSARRALALGAFALHRKPVRAPELLAEIGRACHLGPIGNEPAPS